jgi:magnesium transporter
MIRILERKKELGKIHVKQKPVSGVWIDVENPSEEDVFFLERELNVPREIVLDCLDEDEVPRVVSEKRYTLVIIRVPSHRRQKFETVTLGIIITKKHIITIHRDKLDVLDGFLSGEYRFSTLKRVRFMLQIFRVIIQQYTKILRHMEKNLRKTERRFIKQARNEDILHLMNMKEQVLDFQNAIYENNKVLEAILSGHYIRLYLSGRRAYNYRYHN